MYLHILRQNQADNPKFSGIMSISAFSMLFTNLFRHIGVRTTKKPTGISRPMVLKCQKVDHG